MTNCRGVCFGWLNQIRIFLRTFSFFLSALAFSFLEKIYWKIVFRNHGIKFFYWWVGKNIFYRSCKTIENVRPWPKLIKIYNARVSQLKQWPSPWELTTKRRTRKKSSARVPILLLTILGILFLTLSPGVGTEIPNFWDLDQFFKILGFHKDIFGIGIPRISLDCMVCGSNFGIGIEIWKFWDRDRDWD